MTSEIRDFCDTINTELGVVSKDRYNVDEERDEPFSVTITKDDIISRTSRKKGSQALYDNMVEYFEDAGHQASCVDTVITIVVAPYKPTA